MERTLVTPWAPGRLVPEVHLLWMLAMVALAAPPDRGGVYEVAESPDQLRRRQAAAVEQSAQALPWFTRLFARPVLHRAVWSCGELEVWLGPEILSIRCDDKPTLELPADGALVSGVGPSGEPFEARAEIEGDRIRLWMRSALGERLSELDLGQEGTFLCHRRVESAQLPVALDWEVPYRLR